MVGGEPRVRGWLPRALRGYSGGEEPVELSGATLAKVIERLNARFPGLGYRLLDDQGRMRRYVLVFVNEDSVGDAGPDAVRLRDGDTVDIVPSVAGGWHGRTTEGPQRGGGGPGEGGCPVRLEACEVAGVRSPDPLENRGHAWPPADPGPEDDLGRGD